MQNLLPKKLDTKQQTFLKALVFAYGCDNTDTLAPDTDEICSPTNRGTFLPCRALPGLGKTRTVIAFDYVEYTGKKTDGFLTRKQDKYRVQEGAADFLKEIQIELDGTWQSVGTLHTDLKAGIDKSWCKFKLNNKFCWQAGSAIIELIKDMNHALGIFFIQYTRLDVCCDFQSTDYRGFTPQDFINKCAKGDYTFKGKKYKYIPPDSKKADVDFYDAKCETEGRGHRVETIRIGKRTSGLSCTMYNKTREMKVKSDKPWIREAWNEAGFFTDIDTFRIEFSYMKAASTFILLEKDSGEFEEKLQHQNINCLLELDEIFRTMYSKHFVVSIYQSGVRFSRRKPVVLLTVEDTFYIKTRLTDKLKSTNNIKASIRRTVMYAKEYEKNECWDNHCSEVYRMVQNMIERHDLHRWFNFNFPDICFDEKILPDGTFVRALVRDAQEKEAYVFGLKQENAFFQTNTCRFN